MKNAVTGKKDDRKDKSLFESNLVRRKDRWTNGRKERRIFENTVKGRVYLE